MQVPVGVQQSDFQQHPSWVDLRFENLLMPKLRPFIPRPRVVVVYGTGVGPRIFPPIIVNLGVDVKVKPKIVINGLKAEPDSQRQPFLGTDQPIGRANRNLLYADIKIPLDIVVVKSNGLLIYKFIEVDLDSQIIALLVIQHQVLRLIVDQPHKIRRLLIMIRCKQVHQRPLFDRRILAADRIPIDRNFLTVLVENF